MYLNGKKSSTEMDDRTNTLDRQILTDEGVHPKRQNAMWPGKWEYGEIRVSLKLADYACVYKSVGRSEESNACFLFFTQAL